LAFLGRFVMIAIFSIAKKAGLLDRIIIGFSNILLEDTASRSSFGWQRNARLSPWDEYGSRIDSGEIENAYAIQTEVSSVLASLHQFAWTRDHITTRLSQSHWLKRYRQIDPPWSIDHPGNGLIVSVEIFSQTNRLRQNFALRISKTMSKADFEVHPEVRFE
jgi:hypothetical protein